MHERIRNLAAIVIAGLCLALAIPGLFAPEVAFTGITLRLDASVLVVAAVDPASRMAGEIQPGMVVSEVNYTPTGGIAPKEMDAYLRGDFVELGTPDPAGGTTEWTFAPNVAAPAGFVFLVGVGILFGMAIWVGRGLAGETLRPLAIPLAVASAAPLILIPAWFRIGWPTFIVALALPTVALLVLADGIVECIPQRTRRRVVALVAVAAASAYVALAIGILGHADLGVPEIVFPLAVALSAAVTLVPAASLVTSGRRIEALGVAPGIGRLADRSPIILAALTPPVIATTYGGPNLGFGLSVPLLWLLFVVVVLQANTRFETLRIQRDTVVAATEVERARLAADLHDDALQEMTVLVRRLDDAGDERAAALARSIADRLREVCGELRLPILDELGAGPALEWLVERVGHASGGQVRLELDDAGRPPADVELAVFRVAQEALANAVTHGAPPIVVRYAAASDRASLSIIDQGAGIAPDAAAVASRSGHYGLLNMRQRAEQIGATIDVRRSLGGGTAVGLSWSST